MYFEVLLGMILVQLLFLAFAFTGKIQWNLLSLSSRKLLFKTDALFSLPDKREADAKISGRLPQHVAFIVDGNGRWALEKGLPRQEGHAEGAAVTVEIAKDVFRSGIPFLTFFLFSQENWARPVDEVANIMNLLEKYLKDMCAYLVENRIRLVVIGDKDRLPFTSQVLIETVEKSTETLRGKTLCLAISYSGRNDILNAFRSIDLAGIKSTEISEEVFNKHLSLGSKGIPDPDLLVRTSGEQRLSNFLLYQVAYSEMAFVDKYWPDFSVEECREVLSSFAKRNRRFGDIQSH